MTAWPWFVTASERLLCDESDPAEERAPAAPPDAIELDICADSPVRIETTPEGGLNITCYRLEERSRMVTMRLRFTPAAAANLIGGLYRAVQSGALNADEDEPPTH
jgi:hypothetical protein